MISERGVDDPAVDRRHQVVAFCRRDERVGATLSPFSSIIETSSSKCSTRPSREESATDRLVAQTKAPFIERTRDPIDPAHLGLPLPQLLVFRAVDLDLVAAGVLGRVARGVGR